MRPGLDIFLVVLLAALTAACSGILGKVGGPNTAAPEAPPADYRALIRQGVPATLTNGAMVSDLRKAVALQPGDWMACLKSDVKSENDVKPSTTFFAVFIEDGKINTFRRSVLIDHCESAAYSPLSPPTPPKKTARKPKKTTHN